MLKISVKNMTVIRLVLKIWSPEFEVRTLAIQEILEA